jgi:hypothetical protein
MKNPEKLAILGAQETRPRNKRSRAKNTAQKAKQINNKGNNKITEL